MILSMLDPIPSRTEEWRKHQHFTPWFQGGIAGNPYDTAVPNAAPLLRDSLPAWQGRTVPVRSDPRHVPSFLPNFGQDYQEGDPYGVILPERTRGLATVYYQHEAKPPGLLARLVSLMGY